MQVKPPKDVSLDNSLFYHKTDLPELAKREWGWDLRRNEHRYIGEYPIADKSVLEVGPANGVVSFAMEKLGAKVTVVDLAIDRSKPTWDVIVDRKSDNSEMINIQANHNEKLRNGFWYLHKHYNSKVEFLEGNAYDYGCGDKTFDIVVLNSILLHIRNPLEAVDNAARHADEAVIITDREPEDTGNDVAVMQFMPNRATNIKRRNGGWTWWNVKPRVYMNYLDLLGFRDIQLKRGRFRHRANKIELFTILAKR